MLENPEPQAAVLPGVERSLVAVEQPVVDLEPVAAAWRIGLALVVARVS